MIYIMREQCHQYNFVGHVTECGDQSYQKLLWGLGAPTLKLSQSPKQVLIIFTTFVKAVSALWNLLKPD